ncbi:Protein CBG18885 [Caenorhabditis briggsae]|uniref:Protein CBG18885 n=1 Tax=Caenorhabditis briggsae TaxID=6238 RepID=A8XUA2_CAEBR|nr:Protein CBG18885 [Caenorhabditis briggsae]CAP36227.2 Protein CBG18885 [Caenorhabditis briggsae]
MWIPSLLMISNSDSKSCQQQQKCQTPMRINAYCSEKGICCQEDSEGSESLCYDKRLPLLGEPKCSSDSDCMQDSDCYPGYICVRTIDEGMCFKNPEDCSNSPYYYIAVMSCYLSFVLMLLYFFTRACYEHPLRVSAKSPVLTLQLYSVIKEAELQAYDIYGGEELSKMQIEHISKEAARKAWIENE